MFFIKDDKVVFGNEDVRQEVGWLTSLKSLQKHFIYVEGYKDDLQSTILCMVG